MKNITRQFLWPRGKGDDCCKQTIAVKSHVVTPALLGTMVRMFLISAPVALRIYLLILISTSTKHFGSVRWSEEAFGIPMGIGIPMGTQNAELELFLFFGFLFFYVFIVLEQRVEDQDLFEKTLVGSSRCSHITQWSRYSWQLKVLCQRRHSGVWTDFRNHFHFSLAWTKDFRRWMHL